MKKYKSTGVTGRAGELYFAYWIVRYFNWPCRLLDIDVGIDAQVEIFEDEISTGDFLRFKLNQRLETPLIYRSIYLTLCTGNSWKLKLFWSPS